MSAHRASAGRAEKCASGDGLAISAPARVVREPARNQVGGRVIRIAVANQRLRGWERLRHIFRPVAPRWPHCAVGRHAPPPSALTSRRPVPGWPRAVAGDADHDSRPRHGGRFGRRTPLKHADAVRSRNAPGAIPRAGFPTGDPWCGEHPRRIRAPGGCRPHHPL